MGAIESLTDKVEKLLLMQEMIRDIAQKQESLIRVITASKGLNQQELAVLWGVHHNTVGGYLKNFIENRIEPMRDAKGRPKIPIKLSFEEAYRVKDRLRNEKFVQAKNK